MSRLTTASALSLALALAAPATCLGQQSSLFGGGGGGRSSTGGMSGGSTGRSSTGGMGTTGTSGSMFGGSGGGSRTGTSGTGRQTGAARGGVQEPQFNEFGSVGNQIGQGAFVGRSDNSGRFVGQGLAGQQTNLGTRGLGQLGAGNRGRNGTGNNNANNGNANNSNQSQRRVRPQLKVAFPTNPVPPTAITTSLQQRLSTETLTAGTLRNVQLEMTDEGIVTLRGSVASEDARSLAAAMVRLEPGVRKVVNEIAVEQ